jgi:hypothetical protein
MRTLLAIAVAGMIAATAQAQAKHINTANLTPGVGGVAGTTVRTVPGYYGGPQGYYNYNYFNYNTAFMNAYGYYPGFNNAMLPTGQFYMMLGGPAPSNPFPNKFASAPPFQTINNPAMYNLPGYAPTSVLPFGYYNYTNIPQNPMLNFAPVVGQSNGFFAAPQAPLPVQDPTQFGVQGVNGFGNLKNDKR